MNRLGIRWLSVVIVLTTAAAGAQAYVQWAYRGAVGSILTVQWSSPTVAWFVDGGGTGTPGVDATALTRLAFAYWNDLPTSDLAYSVAGSTSGDIQASHLVQVEDPFLGAVLDADRNLNEVIFDADSSILRTFFGGSPFLLGVGMPQSNSAGAITGANMILFPTNLNLSTQTGINQLVAVIAHEAGHTAGFGHTPTAPDNPTADPARTPLMYPFLVGDTMRLTPDDVGIAATTYPSALAASTFGRVSGTVRDSNARAIFGAVVELFSTSDLTTPIIGTLSGAGLGPGHGTYTLGAVPPGTYYARIEAVSDNFEAVRIGGIYESVAASVTPEIYHQQTAFTTATPVTVTAGGTVTGVNFGAFSVAGRERMRPVEGYPNPFLPLPGGTITFRIQQVAELQQMRILSIDGRVIYREGYTDRRTEATWNGRNASGDLVGSGSYLVELQDIHGRWARGRFTLVH